MTKLLDLNTTDRSQDTVLKAMVDDIDFDRCAYYHWTLKNHHGNDYAVCSMKYDDGTWKQTALHTFLTGYEMCDHIDGNGLNNRRENLRPVTNNQNQWNARVKKTCISGFKGVSYRKDTKKFRARIMVDGQRENLGHFKTAEEAAERYDIQARLYFGEFACLNFPEDDERGCRE